MELFLIAFFVYFAGFCVSIFYAIKKGKNTIILPISLIAGFLLQIFGFASIGSFKEHLSPFEFLTFISFLMVPFQLSLWKYFYEKKQSWLFVNFGTFIICIIALCGYLFGDTQILDFSIKTSSIYKLHAVLAMISYILFFISSMASVSYLIQSYSLSKKKNYAIFNMLLPLKKAEYFSKKFLLAGIIFLGLSICLGTFFSENFAAFAKSIKFISTIIVWTFSILIYLLKGKLLNQKAFSFSLIGLLILTMCSLIIVTDYLTK